MAEIIKNPELRYTSDNQMAVTDMFVQFSPPPGSRPDERSPTIEVVGWGKLATEIKENYKIGDRVTIEGRLEMITIERDGYKEKRAKLVASQIYHLAIDTPLATGAAMTPSSPPSSSRASTSTPPARTEEPPSFEDDSDKIPF